MSTKLFYRNQLRLLGLLCLMATLSLFSCQDQEIPIEQVVAEEVDAAIPDDAVVLGRARTPEAAIAEAIDAMEALETINHTGAKSNRRVGDITAVRNPEFGAKGNNLPDTMMYIVNFADDMGYALVSADYRTSTIYALIPEGNFNINDEEAIPPALAIYYAKAEKLYQQEIEEFNKQIESNEASPMFTIIPEPGNFVSYGKWQTSISINPLVPVRWGQKSPFNDKAPLINGQRALAGCVATAIAQVMAYHKYPITYNWEELTAQPYGQNMSQNAKKEVAKLFRNIGDNVGMIYGLEKTGGSGAQMSEASTHFKKMGYFKTGIYQEYDFNTTKSSLENGSPIIIEGFCFQETTFKGFWFWKKKQTINSGGHAWVIDGMLRRVRERVLLNGGMVVNTVFELQQLVHCNFGWHDDLTVSSHDGYYLSEVFDVNYEPIIESPNIGSKDGIINYFQFDLKALYNIRP